MSDPINDSLVYSTIKIENEDGAIGTGFLIKKETKKILVTNKHVLHKSKSKRESANSIYLHLNVLDNERIKGQRIQFALYDNGKKMWNEHPDVQIDVLGIDVSEICRTITNLVAKPIETSLISNGSILRQYNIASGREIVVLGYPHTVQHTENNFPMTIQGTIISRIGETITHRWDNPITGKIENMATRGFAVEGNVVLGSSGSPVFLNPVINMFGGDQNTIGKRYPPFLLGIVSEEKLTYLDTGYASYSGSIMVFDASTIVDVINLFHN